MKVKLTLREDPTITIESRLLFQDSQGVLTIQGLPHPIMKKDWDAKYLNPPLGQYVVKAELHTGVVVLGYYNHEEKVVTTTKGNELLLCVHIREVSSLDSTPLPRP